MKQTKGALMLCSYKLAFTHPFTKKKLVFEMENPFSL